MDNPDYPLLGPTMRNVMQRLALGSLYLSLLFVLLSVSFFVPMVSEVTDSAGLAPDAGEIAPALPAEDRSSANREG